MHNSFRGSNTYTVCVGETQQKLFGGINSGSLDKLLFYTHIQIIAGGLNIRIEQFYPKTTSCQ